jgi:predicted deacylase
MGVVLAAALAAVAGCTARPESVRTPVAPVVIDVPDLPAPPEVPSAEVPPAEIAPPRVVRVGESRGGCPLDLEIFGDARETVLVLGGIHGNEPTGADVAARLADHLRRSPADAGGVTVAVLAACNPDGLARRSRLNAAGVDINRNFPARNWGGLRGRLQGQGGPCPASEPETVAILRAIELVAPSRIIALHSTSRGRHGNNYDGPAEALAAFMARFNGYRVLATMGYATPGSLGSWAGVDRGIPIITLELPREQSGEDAWLQNREALFTVICGRPAVEETGVADAADAYNLVRPGAGPPQDESR